MLAGKDVDGAQHWVGDLPRKANRSEYRGGKGGKASSWKRMRQVEAGKVSEGNGQKLADMVLDIGGGTGEEAKIQGRGMTAEKKQGRARNDNTARGNYSEQRGLRAR
jgi:hypothetical protein